MYEVTQHGEIVLFLFHRVLFPVRDDRIPVYEIHRGTVCRYFCARTTVTGYLGRCGRCSKKCILSYGLGKCVSGPVSGEYTDAGPEVDVGADRVHFPVS